MNMSTISSAMQTGFSAICTACLAQVLLGNLLYPLSREENPNLRPGETNGTTFRYRFFLLDKKKYENMSSARKAFNAFCMGAAGVLVSNLFLPPLKKGKIVYCLSGVTTAMWLDPSIGQALNKVRSLWKICLKTT
jgi:hypothetical protein